MKNSHRADSLTLSGQRWYSLQNVLGKESNIFGANVNITDSDNPQDHQ
jgi:hypothetical protein